MLIHLPNSVEWLVSFLATLRAGHVPASANSTRPSHRGGDRQVVETTGRIDVLVTMLARIEPVAEMSITERCLTSAHVRLHAPRAATDDSAAKAGVFVNISSIAAWEMSTDHGAAYSAAKAGVWRSPA